MIGIIVGGLLVIAVFAALGYALDRVGDRWRA